MSEYFQNIIYTVKSMISGMSLTWEHFINKEKHVVTLQYPNEKWPQPDRNIGFEHSEYNEIRSRLHVDIDDCIGCLMCERACPVDCIKIDTLKPPNDSDYDCGKTSHDTQKKMIVPRFSIDMSECMYCNLCVYPCPEECIFMVGGPNEPKHEIDYEFSKYVKHDLIFEFSNNTEQDIIDIGGQSYLDQRKEIETRISEGNELKGGVTDKEVDSDGSDKPESKKHVDPGFEVFKDVGDKMSRGIAKKAYTYGRRNNMDMVAIAKYVEEAINSYKKMTPEMEDVIKGIIEFKYPEESDKDSDSVSQDEVVEEKASVDSTSLFDIKKLNDILDKMIRGSLKKIYMAGKRTNKITNEVIKDMTTYLDENNLMNDDIKNLLYSLNVKEQNEAGQISSKDVEIDSGDKKESLFDIKGLNAIDDKMIRGTAKKIYMSGKRNGKDSNDVIEEIINTLKDNDKINEDIENLLKGLK